MWMWDVWCILCLVSCDILNMAMNTTSSITVSNEVKVKCINVVN